MSGIFKHNAKMVTSSPANFPQEKRGQVLVLILPLSGSLTKECWGNLSGFKHKCRMECVTEDVIFVHMEKFQKLKQVIISLLVPSPELVWKLPMASLKNKQKSFLLYTEHTGSRFILVKLH